MGSQHWGSKMPLRRSGRIRAVGSSTYWKSMVRERESRNPHLRRYNIKIFFRESRMGWEEERKRETPM